MSRPILVASFAAATLSTFTGCEPEDFTPSREVLIVEETLPAVGIDELDLLQGRGPTTIQPSDDGQLLLRVTLLGPKGSDRDEDMKDRLLATLEVQGATAIADSRLDGNGHAYGLKTELFLPAGLDVVVDDDSGDLSITGMGRVAVDDDSGDVTIEQSTGSVVVDDDSGELTISEVAGDVFVTDDSGDLIVRAVTGDVSIEDDSGDIVVESVGGDVAIDDDSGDMTLSDIAGTATVSDGSGDIFAPGVDLVILEDTSGDVR